MASPDLGLVRRPVAFREEPAVGGSAPLQGDPLMRGDGGQTLADGGRHHGMDLTLQLTRLSAPLPLAGRSSGSRRTQQTHKESAGNPRQLGYLVGAALDVDKAGSPCASAPRE